MARYQKGSGQRREGTAADGGSIRVLDLFDGLTVSEGGWYYGKKWMQRADAEAARRRWWLRGLAEAPKVPFGSGRNAPEWVEHQCGGCKFFAALDADWGICWNAESPQDGRLVFEHNGCAEHTYG